MVTSQVSRVLADVEMLSGAKAQQPVRGLRKQRRPGRGMLPGSAGIHACLAADGHPWHAFRQTRAGSRIGDSLPWLLTTNPKHKRRRGRTSKERKRPEEGKKMTD